MLNNLITFRRSNKVHYGRFVGFTQNDFANAPYTPNSKYSDGSGLGYDGVQLVIQSSNATAVNAPDFKSVKGTVSFNNGIPGGTKLYPFLLLQVGSSQILKFVPKILPGASNETLWGTTFNFCVPIESLVSQTIIATLCSYVPFGTEALKSTLCLQSGLTSQLEFVDYEAPAYFNSIDATGGYIA